MISYACLECMSKTEMAEFLLSVKDSEVVYTLTFNMGCYHIRILGHLPEWLAYDVWNPTEQKDLYELFIAMYGEPTLY